MTRMMKMSCAILAFCAVPLFARATAPPALEKAFSVQMAVTSNAASMPEADNPGAWVVAVSGDNKLYFGPDPVTPEELANLMKGISHKRDAKLYIKADARARFSLVRDVMDLGHQAGFVASVFLTSQREYVLPGTPGAAERAADRASSSFRRRIYRDCHVHCVPARDGHEGEQPDGSLQCPADRAHRLAAGTP